jgi:hypothetical protein
MSCRLHCIGWCQPVSRLRKQPDQGYIRFKLGLTNLKKVHMEHEGLNCRRGFECNRLLASVDINFWVANRFTVPCPKG